MRFITALSSLLVAGTTIFTTSCDDSSGLAKKVEGTWSGAPEHLIDNSASSATITETYSFFRDPNAKSGDVVRSALVSVSGQISGTQAVIQPFSMTAGATAVVRGRWDAHDDDEIYFIWNDSTLTVNVDPEAVTLSMNILTGNESPSLDSLKPQLAESIRAQVARAVEVRFIGTRKFDDVKIKGNIMDYEVNDIKSHMARQGQSD